MPLVFSPDSKLLAGCGPVVWEIPSGRLRASLTDGTDTAFLPRAFGPDGKMLASISLEGTIELWEGPIWKKRSTLFKCDPKSDLCATAAFAHDGNVLAFATTDGTIRLRDLLGNKELAALKGNNRFSDLAFSPDGKVLASVTSDIRIRLWNLTTFTALTTREAHADGIECLAFSPNGKMLASCSRDKSIKLWDISK
jgi:WD40 repeat protein